MDESLFKKIIDDLEQLEYSGRLALHSNNEPFLDKRIESFAEIARKQLPKAYIFLYTNGSLLTVERLLKIIDNIDNIYIDNYDDDLQMSEHVQTIYDYCLNDPKISPKITVELRKQNEVLTTRGGQAPNNEKRKPISLKCIFPWQQVIIRPTGKVSLCCNDAHGKYTMGNVTNQTPAEVWNSAEFKEIRRRMKKQGRLGLDLCMFCDSHGLLTRF